MKKKFQQRLMLMLLYLAFSLGISAQVTISGVVSSSSDSEPLIGASVLVKGTTSGTVTDIDGKFEFQVSEGNAVLVVSYTGYTTQEILVGNQTVFTILLEEGSTLDEVVVTGYTGQSRRTITGSVAVVDTRDMVKLGSSNIAEQLQGKVSGVQIGTSGDPGSASFVRIRGFGTVNNNEPLYVIDGIPVQNEANLNFLNPNDVESMQVLKDASAASIYGSRAANGVIIITTKKGKLGTSKINVDIFTGMQSPPNSAFPELANPTQLLEITKRLSEGAGQTFSDKLYPLVNGQPVLPDFITRAGGFRAGEPEVDPSKYFLTPDPLANADVNYLIQQGNKEGTDWMRELINSAPMTNYQISASGGTDKGNYFISANYYDHEGIVIENNYKRYQARANSSFRVKDKIQLGQTFNFAYQTTLAGIGNPGEGSSLVSALRIPEIVPTADIQGNTSGAYGTGSNASNPLIIQRRAAQNPGHSARILGSIFADVDFFKYFTATSRFGIDYNTGRNKGYGFRNFENTEVNAANSLNESQFTNSNWVFSNTIKFQKDITDQINLNVLAGYEARNIHYIGFNASGTKLDFGDDPNFRVLGNVTAGRTVGGYEGSTSKVSQFGQMNLDLFEKYLISATIRRDGSSKFLNNRYGVFPGGSVGWIVSNEPFLQNLAAISNLKIRAGYGVTGNDEASGDFPGFTNYNTSPGNSSYDINGTGNSVVAGFQAGNTVGNPDLKWETTKMFNIGLDLSLWNKLDMILEWYNKKTEDMIFPVELPWTGATNQSRNENIGDMKNVGVDLNLTYKGKAIANKLDYSVGLTWSTYENEVLRLDANGNTFQRGNGSRIGDINFTQAGLPISQIYGYIVDGLWQSDEEINRVLYTNPGGAKVGRFKFRDINGDGEITDNDEDNAIIGNPHPDYMFGFNLTASFKNFDFTAYIQGVQGNDIFNFTRYFTHFPAFQANYHVDMLNKAGTELPVLDRNDNYSASRNSFYVEDGSYIRGRNFQLGYSLPTNMVGKWGIDKLRVYIQAQNLFTITDYTGFDPDITVSNITEGYTQRRDFGLGVDYGRYPTPRVFMFGVNLEF